MKTDRIRLDLTCEDFMDEVLGLQKQEQLQILATWRKLRKLAWKQLLHHRGFNWEQIHSRRGDDGERLYSIRLGKGFRAVVCRRDDFMTFISLHPDHDSAYRA